MKTLLLGLFLLLGTQNFFSQDTIRFLNNTIKVVKVTEINVDEIKYHRFDNLDGPLYVSSKSEIESIKFSNGLVETFKTDPVAVQKPTTYTVVTSNLSPYSEKIIINDTKLVHMGKPMGESRLLRLINNHPDATKKSILMKEYLVMKTYKKKQYVFGFVGLGAAVLLPYIGTMTYLISGNDAPLAVGLIGGISFGATGAVLAIINKQKRLKKKVEIATIYNNL